MLLDNLALTYQETRDDWTTGRVTMSRHGDWTGLYQQGKGRRTILTIGRYTTVVQTELIGILQSTLLAPNAGGGRQTWD